jgi:hypothetical protein
VDEQEGNVNQEQSLAETEARHMGWVPKDEFNGDEHKWVDAGEFVRRGELFKKIDLQNKELKEVKQTIKLLAQHNARIKEDAYKQAIADLKAQKKEALLDGDADAVIEIDEQLIDVKEQQKTFKNTVTQEIKQDVEQLHPEFEAFIRRNGWYTTDEPMKAFADAVGRSLAQAGKSPSEVLSLVETRVREEFPNRFRNPNRDKPGSVEGASKRSGAAAKGAYQPTEFERQAARKFVKQGAFKNEDEYYKQLQGLA